VSPNVVLLINVIASASVGGLAFAAWLATRRRFAAETVGRAEADARRIVRDAERDAETRRKEALLDAKEKAHDLLMESER
jgi:ribonucrease Y